MHTELVNFLFRDVILRVHAWQLLSSFLCLTLSDVSTLLPHKLYSADLKECLTEEMPSSVVVSILLPLTSASMAFNSSTSQFAHATLPLRKRASGLASQTMK